MKFPKSLGACVDLAYQLRQKRQAAQKAVDALAEDENELKEFILATFDKGSLDGAKGKLATAGVVRKTVATVNDWEAVYKYIAKNKAFELLQQRISDSAYRERLEAKEVVPGIEPFVAISLSLTKVGKG